MILVAAILFALVFVVVTGLLFMAAFLVLLNGVTGLGLVSYDALADWYQRSLPLGTSWFLRLVFGAVGSMTGVFGCVVFGLIFGKELPLALTLAGGIAAGAGGGLGTGVLAFRMLKRYFRHKSAPAS